MKILQMTLEEFKEYIITLSNEELNNIMSELEVELKELHYQKRISGDSDILKQYKSDARRRRTIVELEVRKRGENYGEHKRK